MSSTLDIGPLNTGNTLDIGPLQTTPSGGGTPINLTFSDNFNFSDSIIINCLPFADTLVLQDSVIVVAPIVVQVSDSFVSLWGDFVNSNLGIPISIIEFPLPLVDSISILLNAVLSVNVNDSLTLSDSVLVFTSTPLKFSDQIILQDFVTIFNSFANVFGDSLSLTDLVQLVLSPIANLAPADSFTLSDSVTIQLNSIFTPINLSFNDSLALSDGVSFGAIPETIAFSDSFMFQDHVTVSVITYLNPYIRRYLNDVIGTSNP